jgi:hypothetical protein
MTNASSKTILMRRTKISPMSPDNNVSVREHFTMGDGANPQTEEVRHTE